jgi:hypothetical protein
VPGICKPLGEFENMTFHSNFNIGLRIYPQWTPTVDSFCAGTQWPQYLYNMASFHNGGNALFTKKMGKIVHVNATLIASSGPEIAIMKYKHVDFDSIPSLLRAVIVGSVNPYGADSIGVVHPQDEFFYLKDCTWLNYRSQPAMGGCNGCLSGEFMRQGSFTTRLSGAKYVNSFNRVAYISTEKEVRDKGVLCCMLFFTLYNYTHYTTIHTITHYTHYTHYNPLYTL